MIDDEVTQRRRKSILAVLYFAPAQTLNVYSLRDELEKRHGMVVSVDKIRADLLFLKEVEYVVLEKDIACLTLTGMDVVTGRRESL
ncbi:MAG: hypothetical protein LBQ81_08655 [Zoogloeaceae bacterium]|jgi:hypothetical protein|nr:hypothetical protein [Zoogloeaceae bacterium]